MNPFFSVAVTTYDRVDLLRETLESILTQTFEDFEILVGNDNQDRQIQKVFPDLIDSRIRWIDHPINLGYVKNVNQLLELARGRYFTSLGDDDVYFPQYLETMHRSVTEYGPLDVAFSGYIHGATPPSPTNISKDCSIQILSANEWLQGYLSKRLPAIGCYGVFKKKFIQSLGGIHELGTDPFSPYNDNLLAVQAALADQIAYCPEPLLYYRLHDGSISLVSKSYDAFYSAQKDFLKIADDVCRKQSNQKDRTIYREFLFIWFIGNYFQVMQRSKTLSLKSIGTYSIFVLANIFSTKNKLRVFGCLIFYISSCFAHYYPRLNFHIEPIYQFARRFVKY